MMDESHILIMAIDTSSQLWALLEFSAPIIVSIFSLSIANFEAWMLAST